jgi:hypothetical protein
MGVNAMQVEGVAREAVLLKCSAGKRGANTPTPALSPFEGARSHAPPPMCVAPRM